MICIAGKNDIAAQVLTFAAGHFGAKQIVAIANRDDAGHANWQQSLIATAQQLGVTLLTLEQVYELPKLHFFSVEFDRIVVPARFQPDAQLYNIHFSLLPRYKGVYTSVWPLLNGETETGVTLHRMEAGIDTGPLVHQARFPITLSDTARDVYHGCLRLGAEVLQEFIPQLVSKPDPGQAQSALHSTYYSSKSLDFANLTINLRQTAFQLHNTVRAFCFQEYQLPIVLGRRVRGAQITEQVSTAKPGTLLTETEESFCISTVDFNLALIKDYSFALVDAVRDGDVLLVNELAPRLPSLEVRTRQGWTPLMMAAYAGNIQVVKALIAAGADVNATTKKGTTPLMYAKSVAVHSNDLVLINLLLDSGADASARDKTGQSVLDYARLEGSPAVIGCLLEWLGK